jgi:ATP-dependent Clp protease adaptor protein ClpS
VFGYSPEKGLELAKCVDETGRAIVKTTHKELAELKRDQIVAYGADIRMDNSKGGMAAVVEEAR